MDVPYDVEMRWVADDPPTLLAMATYIEPCSGKRRSLTLVVGRDKPPCYPVSLWPRLIVADCAWWIQHRRKVGHPVLVRSVGPSPSCDDRREVRVWTPGHG